MKPIISIFMTLMIVLSFTACGKSMKESMGTTTVILSESTQPQNTPEPTETEIAQKNIQ